jgi:N-acetylglucosaminyl-diphospho-decaprenol L-rhamnosyltransferase
MSATPELSIIIVNWRSAAFLRKCLASIFANTKNLAFETIVVDNASFDGADAVCAEYPLVQYIQSNDNLGFAKANNLGFRHSKGEFVLLLNPDTEVIGDALKTLVECMKARPEVGIVGAKLFNSDMTIQTSCIQAFPTVLNQFLDTEFLRNRFPRSSFWGTWPLFSGQTEPSQIEVVSGACLLIRRSVFEQVGLFTENFFMYAEDVDLCYKVHRAGQKILYEGRAEVVHHGGQSSSKEPQSNFATVMTRESLHAFMAIHRGKTYAALFQVATGVAACFRLLLLFGVYVLTLGQYQRQAVRVAVGKWKGVLRWSLGLETWVHRSARAS